MTLKKITRRKLLKNSAVAAVGSSLLMGLPKRLLASEKTQQLTKVVLIRNKDVFDADSNLVESVMTKMLDDAVMELSGMDTPKKAWAKYLRPDDILGIKTNVWSHLRTPVALEQAIKSRAMEIGIIEKNIDIDDRGILNNPVFKRSTALINIRPMRTHNWSGVGSLLKNYIMFVDKPSDYHPDSCADLAKLWTLPHVKGKTRLNILVMLTPLFHGIGPHHYNKKFVWNYGGLVVSPDPVAADSVGVRILQAKRKEYFGEKQPLNPPAKHIMLADTRHHLGIADPEKIDLVKIGWKEGILI